MTFEQKRWADVKTDQGGTVHGLSPAKLTASTRSLYHEEEV
jgi:hypothetical protein